MQFVSRGVLGDFFLLVLWQHFSRCLVRRIKRRAAFSVTGALRGSHAS